MPAGPKPAENASWAVRADSKPVCSRIASRPRNSGPGTQAQRSRGQDWTLFLSHCHGCVMERRSVPRPEDGRPVRGSGVLGRGHATGAATREPSRASPRRRVLCTNCKKPRRSGSLPHGMPRRGRSQGRSSRPEPFHVRPAVLAHKREALGAVQQPGRVGQAGCRPDGKGSSRAAGITPDTRQRRQPDHPGARQEPDRKGMAHAGRRSPSPP